jgi:hypothetical protein
MRLIFGESPVKPESELNRQKGAETQGHKLAKAQERGSVREKKAKSSQGGDPL